MFKKVNYENVEISKLLKKGISNPIISNAHYHFTLVRLFHLDPLVHQMFSLQKR